MAVNQGSIIKFLASQGINTAMQSGYYSYINTWMDWYSGYVKQFHKQIVSNGLNVRQRDIFHLDMAKRVCEDWASSLVNEDITINISSGNKKTNLFVQGSKGNTGVLGSCDFEGLFSEVIELGYAGGTSALVLTFDELFTDEEGNIVPNEGTRLGMELFNALSIIPISWTNRVIKDCAFVSEQTLNGDTYYVTSYHKLEEDGYVIYNLVSDKLGNSSIENFGLLPVIRTKSMKPLFFIFKPNISNNVQLGNPMGISIYANAIDNLKGCDIAYDSCLREIITGQRIVMMNKCLLTTDDEGRPVAPQDVKQSYMQFFGDDAVDVGEYIKDFHPSLNTDALDKELQNQLNLLSEKVGLGSGYYKFDSTTYQTATEYVGSKNDFMRNARKMTKTLNKTIVDIIRELIFLGKNVCALSYLDENAKIIVDISDGVIESDAQEKEQDRADVAAGLMSKAEFRAKWYGETLEEAQAKIDEMSASTNRVDQTVDSFSEVE